MVGIGQQRQTVGVAIVTFLREFNVGPIEDGPCSRGPSDLFVFVLGDCMMKERVQDRPPEDNVSVRSISMQSMSRQTEAIGKAGRERERERRKEESTHS